MYIVIANKGDRYTHDEHCGTFKTYELAKKCAEFEEDMSNEIHIEEYKDGERIDRKLVYKDSD